MGTDRLPFVKYARKCIYPALKIRRFQFISTHFNFKGYLHYQSKYRDRVCAGHVNTHKHTVWQSTCLSCLYNCGREIFISKLAPSRNNNESKEALRRSILTWKVCCSQWGIILQVVKFYSLMLQMVWPICKRSTSHFSGVVLTSLAVCVSFAGKKQIREQNRQIKPG